MKRIHKIQTSDGMLHDSERDAIKHLEKLRDTALWNVAEPLFQLATQGGHKTYAMGTWMVKNIELLETLLDRQHELAAGLPEDDEDW
jgi:hypothetical protein